MSAAFKTYQEKMDTINKTLDDLRKVLNDPSTSEMFKSRARELIAEGEQLKEVITQFKNNMDEIKLQKEKYLAQKRNLQ